MNGRALHPGRVRGEVGSFGSQVCLTWLFIPLSTLIAALLEGTSMSMYGTVYNNSATPAFGYCNVSYAMDSAAASIVPTPTSNLNETTFGALLYTVRYL
jgi:hypothetical protein